MLKTLTTTRGQGPSFEYAVTFVIVVAVVMAMTTYFKRTVQAQFSKATHYAQNQISAVLNDGSLNLVGNFQAQYEPYYVRQSREMMTRGEVIDRQIGIGGPGSIQEKEYKNYETIVQSTSNQLAPKFAY